MAKRHIAAGALALLLVAPKGGMARAGEDPPAIVGAADDRAEAIVVVGRRSGLPLWRVDGPRGSVVLVGSIDKVTRDTSWDPEPLVEALSMADRLVFPDRRMLRMSPFSLIDYRVRWSRQSRLPAGRSLLDLLPELQIRRLRALRDRGLVPADFQRYHPFHLAEKIQDRVQKGVRYGPAVREFVSRAARREGLEIVAIERAHSKAVADRFFASPPEAFLPCLMDAISLGERGSGEMSARSQAWADRRIAAVLRSPADKVEQSCALATPFADESQNRLERSIFALLRRPGTTMAVLDLSALARKGGILDKLERAGHVVAGPDWRS